MTGNNGQTSGQTPGQKPEQGMGKQMKRRMFSYSMEARSELLSTYSAVLFVGIIIGILCFLFWGKRADPNGFRQLWVASRAWSSYGNGSAFLHFFCDWFFRYEGTLLLLLLFSLTLGAPVLCGGICLWRGISVGYSAAMLAGNRFSLFFVGYVAVCVAISVLYVMAGCKSVWFFGRLVACLRKRRADFFTENVLPLLFSFVLLSAALALLLGGCAGVAQIMYHRLK